LLLVSISLISAAALGYEVLLTRLFSIIHWHHFAYMIISLALLGYGASGTFLTLAGPWLQSRFRSVFAANAGLFGIAMVLCFGLAQRVELIPLGHLNLASGEADHGSTIGCSGHRNC